ncbi:TlpA disulfide reductase family protein [Methylomicrobium sp. Wu6]|uniref:TlpA family protein disulfide reductase n=1 Tax=Methylomicrobium sp. Wu6 TaxID=3107928 RepID=UPI002DD668E4|nr:TlpA disulfide reductase family protein [Methylomicrobium sp. Wu6]MEC4748390.1 TlpA disulfide reductase family protein [Methylomicrobium sp. Wu6]
MNRKTAAILYTAIMLAPCRQILAANAGDVLPKCELNSIDGGRAIDLGEFKGKVVYLDFWASWCGPCAKSFPFMNQLHHELGEQGVTMIGVNLDENAEDAKAFLSQYPANFTIAADKGEQCARQFDVKAMPSSYLIGRDGVIRHVHLGFRQDEGKELREMVEKLLAEKSPAADVK